KAMGFSDSRIAHLTGVKEEAVREARRRWNIRPTYQMVDTCAGEFKAYTPYYYSTYLGGGSASKRRRGKRVLIIGSGPIRIGQGIEFDYSSVKAAETLKEEGYEAVILNNNPETVSTDFDTSDYLYFDPITLEDSLSVLEASGAGAVILQFGGQTAVNLASPLKREIDRLSLGVRILGTPPEAMDLAEDRERFHTLMEKLGIKQPRGGTARCFDEVRELVEEIGYPVLVRPSYVLGGRAMEVIYSEEDLKRYFRENAAVTEEHPTLVDEFLSGAVEVDVDAVSDGKEVLVGGVMEHIEEAGVHSGDSHTSLPPFSLPGDVVEEIEEATRRIALELQTVGLINIQFAVKDGEIYVLEANPRASRTVPYVSKATGIPLASAATRAMLGVSLEEQGLLEVNWRRRYYSVKAPIFPFLKLEGIDTVLGPEMKSTGEVMGVGRSFGEAYYKAILSRLDEKFSPRGTVYITVKDEDKERIVPVAKDLISLGFRIVATPGTAEYLKKRGLRAEVIYRISDGLKPNALQLMREGEVNLIINTPTLKSGPIRDGARMRRLAVEMEIPFITTVEGARAEVEAIRASRGEFEVRSIEEYWKREDQ
ncbi:MAG: carbamoyl-phosphate synthase large subunit, partial [Thermoplasmata archaeon]|nr:carbamoyl-phosphate synthase large subunit [Thermoplasmata archaeon]